MSEQARIQGLPHALALMRLAYAHDPEQARFHIESWIANLEQNDANPQHIRQMRSRLLALMTVGSEPVAREMVSESLLSAIPALVGKVGHRLTGN